jgi:serine/threonine protein kinase
MSDRFFEGTRVGRYELITRLSVGGMAELYLARLDGLGGFQKLVALKTILPDVQDDEQFVKMFLDEARLSAELSHPNLGQVFDLGREPNGPLYLAMEFLAGRDLGAVLKALQQTGQRLPVAMVGRIVRDVCVGLHAAHSHTDGAGQPRPVIHRDVAPKNVMVTFDGSVKVIDFGIAHAGGRRTRTQTGIVKGTPAYMAPEQLTGGRPTASVDVYAVGVMLHECLTGQRLFSASAPLARYEEISAPSTLNPEVPEALDAVVLRALRVEPAERYGSTRELARALSEALPRMAEADDLAELMRALFPGQQASIAALAESARRGAPSPVQLDELARSGVFPIPSAARPATTRKVVPQPRPSAPAPIPASRRTLLVLAGAGAAGLVVAVLALASVDREPPVVAAPPPPVVLVTTSAEEEQRLMAQATEQIAALALDEATLTLRQCKKAGATCPRARALLDRLDDERGAGRLLRQARDALAANDTQKASTMIEAARGTKLFEPQYSSLLQELSARSNQPGLSPSPRNGALTQSPRNGARSQKTQELALALLDDARLELKAGQLNTAIELLRRCETMDPMNADCTVLLASSYARRGSQDDNPKDNERAKEKYRRFLESAPRDDRRRPKVEELLK